MGNGGKANILLSKFKKLLHWLTFKMGYYYNDGLPHWFANFEDPFSQLNLEKYLLGHTNNINEINTVLTIELIHRLFLEA